MRWDCEIALSAETRLGQGDIIYLPIVAISQSSEEAIFNVTITHDGAEETILRLADSGDADVAWQRPARHGNWFCAATAAYATGSPDDERVRTRRAGRTERKKKVGALNLRGSAYHGGVMSSRGEE